MPRQSKKKERKGIPLKDIIKRVKKWSYKHAEALEFKKPRKKKIVKG